MALGGARCALPFGGRRAAFLVDAKISLTHLKSVTEIHDGKAQLGLLHSKISFFSLSARRKKWWRAVWSSNQICNAIRANFLTLAVPPPLKLNYNHL
jgi:hypothetical protein